jgi:CheY-like chemotaxis protein
MRYESCCPLIVDDDSDFRLLLRRAFLKAGVPDGNLRTACDGEEAIRILSTPTSSLATSFVLLDLHLPGKSGLEVLSWIRGFSACPEMPAFLLTSSEEPEHVGRAYDLRTDSYFIKPRDFSDLEKIVQGMLGYWHARGHRRIPGSLAYPRQG